MPEYRAWPQISGDENRSSILLHSYQKTLVLSRLTLTAFFVVYVATLLWAIPWLPYGLSADDYNQRTTSLVLLLFAASGTAFAAVYLRDRKRRLEQMLLSWSSVHDGPGDMRRREYFYDRIVIECEQARSRGAEFTVVTLKLVAQAGLMRATAIAQALAALDPLVKECDCLAAIGQQEIGVLAPRVAGRDASAFTQRLAELVAGALSEERLGRVEAGYAVFGLDAPDAGELISVARNRVYGRDAQEASAPPADSGRGPAHNPDYPAAACAR